jgi:hypothetical protein
MSFILSRKRSDQQLARGLEQITAWPPLPAQRFAGKQATLGRRTAPFLIVFCIGFAITLTCRSYGDATTNTIATSHPQLAAQTAAAETAPEMVSPSQPAINSDPPEPFKPMLIGLATVRQSADQVAAQFVIISEQQFASDIAVPKPARRNIVDKISSAPAPGAAAAPARKPAPQQLPSPAELGLRGSL